MSFGVGTKDGPFDRRDFCVFLCNVRELLGIVNRRDNSLRLLLKCSNLLIIITLIVVFCKLYVFRQNFDSYNILVESLYRNMLHD